MVKYIPIPLNLDAHDGLESLGNSRLLQNDVALPWPQRRWGTPPGLLLLWDAQGHWGIATNSFDHCKGLKGLTIAKTITKVVRPSCTKTWHMDKQPCPHSSLHLVVERACLHPVPFTRWLPSPPLPHCSAASSCPLGLTNEQCRPRLPQDAKAKD